MPSVVKFLHKEKTRMAVITNPLRFFCLAVLAVPFCQRSRNAVIAWIPSSMLHRPGCQFSPCLVDHHTGRFSSSSHPRTLSFRQFMNAASDDDSDDDSMPIKKRKRKRRNNNADSSSSPQETTQQQQHQKGEKEAEGNIAEVKKEIKEVVEDQGEEIEEMKEVEVEPPVVLKPRSSAPVQLKVTDVRELIGETPSPVKSSSSSGSSAGTAPSNRSTSNIKMEMASSGSMSNINSNANSLDDSLERLLEDARRMKEEQDSDELEEGKSVKAQIRNALSAVVTADFFLVCGFLLWFLLGIFASTVLKNDTIQIAFNSKLISQIRRFVYGTKNISTLHCLAYCT